MSFFIKQYPKEGQIMLNVKLRNEEEDKNPPLTIFVEVGHGNVYFNVQDIDDNGYTLFYFNSEGNLVLTGGLEVLSKYGFRLNEKGQVVTVDETLP